MATDQNDYSKMDAAEQAIAARAGSVFVAAQKKHLALGHEVLIAQGDAIYRLMPDGERSFVSRTTPPRILARGKKYRLR